MPSEERLKFKVREEQRLKISTIRQISKEVSKLDLNTENHQLS